ncbi:selenocysteine-specific translation elongation factor [Nitzschia inconspicua]|uniref:Selenocysteine-specific translation elongation factor n=1 Tax=Nitzschia inconspicua TaxID=303405 RepID=A0A9K3M4V4_9STRA|nr:selenocysteine-specific translation elongation factor [Nitzschia inconspicua]
MSESPKSTSSPTKNGDNANSTTTTTATSATPTSNEEVLNVNLGVLGHVDSGKTSLVKSLSTLLSTAALDKSKQSRQRGMTLDLGFSCFFLDLPPHLQETYPDKSKLQMTLVDCPGHASLIRTIIGGAQIIDMVLLVVDAYKGWQAQTTECLVLAELTSPHLVVALNKIDMFPEEERERKLEEAKKKVQERLRESKFPNAPMIGVSACLGGEKVAAVSGQSALDLVQQQTLNVDKLIDLLKESLPAPRRHANKESKTTGPSSSSKSNNNATKDPFYFAIDHCFPIKGMGTVLTGTVLNGSIKVNDVIEFPSLNLERKIKSMQMFKRKTQHIQQGDRAGICVSNFDSSLLERGVCATPGAVHLIRGAIALVRKIPQYPGQLKNNSKYHVSVGHSTVMATVSFWGAIELARSGKNNGTSGTNGSANSSNKEAIESSALGGDADQAGLPYLQFDWNQDFLVQDGLLEQLPSGTEGSENGSSKSVKNSSDVPLLHWALLDFQTPVYCPLQSLVIGSRLDADTSGSGNKHSKDTSALDDDVNAAASSCRLAFCGRLMERFDPKKDVQRIRWYTPKEKRGTISRLGDAHTRQDDGKVVRYEVFGGDLFKKETLIKPFLGMKLVTPQGDVGELKSAFGTSGKFRVYFPGGTMAREGDILRLPFKRFLHDPEKKMRQDDIILPAARPGSRIDVPVKKKTKKSSDQAIVEATGTVEKVKGDALEGQKEKFPMAIVAGLFTPEVDIRLMSGRKIWIPSTKEEGKIAGPFGKAGKCKVSFEAGISESAVGSKAELHEATSS